MLKLTTSNTSPRWGIDSVSVSGSVRGSAAGDTITISWGDGTSSADIIKCDVVQTISPTNTSTVGSFSVTFTVPTSTVGSHTVTASDATAHNASTKFNRT